MTVYKGIDKIKVSKGRVNRSLDKALREELGFVSLGVRYDLFYRGKKMSAIEVFARNINKFAKMGANEFHYIHENNISEERLNVQSLLDQEKEAQFLFDVYFF